MPLDFEFYVGGIEDAILEKLKSEMEPLGVKTFATYSGELDGENLRRALGEITPKFPLVMVSYTDGTDTQERQSPVLGGPILFRHNCSFVVICASDDARGTNAQRRGAKVGNKKLGVYAMLSKVRDALTGLQIVAIINDENNEAIGKELLTYKPLMPEANEFIARLPNITAYAVPFETYFKWLSADRTADETQVSQILLNVESLNTSSGQSENLPGITFDRSQN